MVVPQRTVLPSNELEDVFCFVHVEIDVSDRCRRGREGRSAVEETREEVDLIPTSNG